MHLHRLMVCTSLCLLAACGGGGSGSGAPVPPPNGGGNPPGPAPPSPPTTTPPDLSFSLDHPMITSGDSVTLTWRTSGTGCTAGGGWSGAKVNSGTETVGPV